VGASIGIACYPADGRDFTELLKHADVAMYAAKEAGRGTFRFYEPALGAQSAERLQVANELRSALAKSELVLYWQPVVEGRAAVVGAEALVRWRHPQRGLLGPEEFVPLAEDAGLIRAVGEWTLEHALAQAAAWSRELPGEPWFAINVSAPELAQGDAFVERLAGALKAHGVPGERIELEVTERVLMTHFAENAATLRKAGALGVPGERIELEVTERVLMAHFPENAATLRKAGALGVRFAIDDFGTGYSSLAYLRELPIDKLKVDRLFLRELASNAADQAIVRTIAALAHTLGIGIAAEGVESHAQLERLLAADCEQWQGHLFSGPLEAADFAALVTLSARTERRA